jgi:hypothetical protein
MSAVTYFGKRTSTGKITPYLSPDRKLGIGLDDPCAPTHPGEERVKVDNMTLFRALIHEELSWRK